MSTPPANSRSSLFRDLLTGTATYSIAFFAQRVAGTLMLPVNTKFLTTSDFGVLELLEQTGSVIAILVGSNIAAALGYFYFEDAPDPVEKKNRVVGTTMIGALLLGLAAAILGAVLVQPIGHAVFGSTDYTFYLLIVFASLPLAFVVEAGLSWLRVANLPRVYAAASFLRVGLTVAGVFVLVAGLRLRVLGIMIGAFVAITAVAIYLIVYWLRSTSRHPFDRALFGRMFRFSLPMALSAIGVFVIHFGDRFVLPHYRPMSELGIYGIAYKIGMMLSLVYGAFQTYWVGQVFNISRRDDAPGVIGRIFTYMITVLSFMGLVLIVFCKPVLHIMTKPEFEVAAALVPAIVLAYYLRSVGDFFRCFFVVAGKPGFDAACNWIGTGICLGGYFLLIPIFGLWGAASATVLTFFAIAAVSLVWTRFLNPYALEYRLVKVLLVTAVIMALYLMVPVSATVAQILWGMLLLLSYPALLWILGFLRAGETAVLNRFCHSIPGRVRTLLGRANPAVI